MRRTLAVTGVLVAMATLGCLVSGTLPDGGGSGGGSAAVACTPGGKPCQGCCLGTACKEGRLGSECGADGVACQSCPPETFCRSSGRCGVDPRSRWRVAAFAATLAPKQSSGEAWDPPDGLPDAYVEHFCPHNAASTTSATAAAVDTLEPRWSETGGCILEARELMTAGFSVTVLDDDGRPPSQVITPMSVVKVSEADFDRGYLQASGPGLEALWVRLTKQ